MTEAETSQQHHRSNSSSSSPGTEATTEDVFDVTYKEQGGPRPPRIIVWKNVILMTLLHLSAAYAMLLVPSAAPLTLLWCKYTHESSCYLLTVSLQHVDRLCVCVCVCLIFSARPSIYILLFTAYREMMPASAWCLV